MAKQKRKDFLKVKAKITHRDSQDLLVPQQFTAFKELPIEFRLIIWDLSREKNRVVKIIGAKYGYLEIQPSRFDYCNSVTAIYSIPSLFHACAESRSEALK
jgi:hypothetical protein